MKRPALPALARLIGGMLDNVKNRETNWERIKLTNLFNAHSL